MKQPKKPIKVSQSLMKSIDKYADKEECGLVFEAKFIHNVRTPETEPMALGNWFEFIATGQLPRTGETPEAKRLKSGKLATNYIRMEKQADNYKEMIEAEGFEVISTGHTFKKNKYATGICDVLARKDGRTCVIDLKSSGMLNNKWEENGWHIDFLHEKHNLLIQAVHYTYLAQEEFGEPVDFYFAVYSTKNDKDSALIKIEISEERMLEHINKIRKTQVYFEQEKKRGFKPHPTFKRCTKCFMREECKLAKKTPETQTIYY